MSAALAPALQLRLQFDYSAYASRLMAGLVAGIAVTAGLFWIMQYLLETGEQELVESPISATLEFVLPPREEEEINKKPIDPIPPPAVQPSPPEPTSFGEETKIITFGPGSEPVPHGPGGSLKEIFDSVGDGDYLPLVKVTPIYPQRALAKGMEGHCTVQYTVTTLGTIRDPFVVELQCTHSLFHRVSLDAALKFKYMPRVIDGVAVEVTGVQNRFIFRIDE
jgi:protein TonB